MKTKIEEFEVLIPNLDGTNIAERIKVPVTLEWDEEVNEWLLTPEAHQVIEETKARRIGLLLPAQLKELRERYEYTQKVMGELFQVGEKSWTRWESGKHRPSRSINLIIRALYEGEISVNYLLKRAGKPPREVKAVAEKELASWLAAGSVPVGMVYCLMGGGSVIHYHSKGHLEVGYLKALSNKCVQLSTPPSAEMKADEKSRSLLPSKAGHRFDYENYNLSSMA